MGNRSRPANVYHQKQLGYNRAKKYLSIVSRTPSSLILSILAAALASSFQVSAQTTNAPTSLSAEQLALQRGQGALNQGDVTLARKEFEKAVRLAPNDALAQSALGWVLAQQGEPEAAITHLRAAVKAKPDFID